MACDGRTGKSKSNKSMLGGTSQDGLGPIQRFTKPVLPVQTCNGLSLLPCCRVIPNAQIRVKLLQLAGLIAFVGDCAASRGHVSAERATNPLHCAWVYAKSCRDLANALSAPWRL
jgi:hypothetical protein